MVNMGVSCPTHFPLEVIIIRSYPWWQEDSSLTSWNLSTKFIYIVLLSCKGFFKTAKEGENYSNFTKVLFGLISPCTTLPCLSQKRPSSFLQFGQVVNIHGHLFEKKLWFVLVPYPHRQSIKRMMNILLIISRFM